MEARLEDVPVRGGARWYLGEEAGAWERWIARFGDVWGGASVMGKR